jgi:hypothetical protein
MKIYFNPKSTVGFLLIAACLLFLTHGSWADEGRKIATAVQRGGFVYAYDEKGSQMFSVSAGGGEKDGLVGYTSSTLSIRRGSFIYVYNDKGSQVSSVSAGN